MTCRIVVSSENSLYHAWQTQLLCVSAWRTLQQHPLVVVHGTNEPLRVEFQELRRRGCEVVHTASAAVTAKGIHYPPRNELGTLQMIGEIGIKADAVLLCEPDMLFVRPFPLVASLSAEFYPYLDYRESRVVSVASRYGVGNLVERLNLDRRVGAPYVIPTTAIGRLGRRWLEVLETFEDLHWIDMMYAFGIASAVEGADIRITHWMTDNYRPTRPIRHLIHYCYGHDVWDKRHYMWSSPLDLPDESLRCGVRGTVLGEIVNQIREAKRVMATSSSGALSDGGTPGFAGPATDLQK